MEKPEWTFWPTQYNHVLMSPQLTASATAPSLSYYPCGNSVISTWMSVPDFLSPLLPVSFFLRFYPSLLVAPPPTYGTVQNSRHHSWIPQFQHQFLLGLPARYTQDWTTFPTSFATMKVQATIVPSLDTCSRVWTSLLASPCAPHGLLSAERSEASL